MTVPVPTVLVVAVPRTEPVVVSQVSLTPSLGPKPLTVMVMVAPGAAWVGVRRRRGVTVKVAWPWRPLVAPRAMTG